MSFMPTSELCGDGAATSVNLLRTKPLLTHRGLKWSA